MKQRTIWRLAAIGVTVICLSAAVSEILHDYRTTRELIRQQTQVTANLARAHVDESLNYIRNLFDHLSPAFQSVSSQDEQAVQKLKTRFKDIVAASEAISTIWVTDLQGQRWLNNLDGASQTGSVSHRAYFKESMARPDQLIIGRAEKGRMVNRDRFVVSRALKTSVGTISGVLAVGVDAVHLTRLYDSLLMASNVQLIAFNDRGGVIARSSSVTDEGIALAQLAIAHQAESFAKGVEPKANVGMDGDWIWAVHPSATHPVTLVAGTRMAPALAEWRIRAGQDLILAIVITIGFLLLAQAGVRAIDREAVVTESLRNLNENLEERVQARTQSLHLLLRELNHRIKNNLQIVGSLVRLQSRWHKNPIVAAILDRTHYRIFAIADLYSELEQAQTGSASSRQFFERIAKRIVESSTHPGQKLELVLDIDDMALTVDQAVPLGLIVNELVTNVVKHAFPNSMPGRIEIMFRNYGDQTHLIVRDNGMSVAGQLRGRGLGRRIVELLVQQLHGSMTIEDQNGRIVCVKAPLRNLESGNSSSYSSVDGRLASGLTQDHPRAAE